MSHTAGPHPCAARAAAAAVHLAAALSLTGCASGAPSSDRTPASHHGVGGASTHWFRPGPGEGW
ncbi:hypothetical protein [Streptomyces sp. NPDC029704]|uniref:hypothetical protein n=1 Tax=Streptomyces sp. NPDC029704 TaxID=3156920 RepID=UPI0034083B66